MKTKLQNLFMAALTLAASTQKLGVNLIRVAILVIFVWIGGLKFWNYEAEGIVPFVANSPFMSLFQLILLVLRGTLCIKEAHEPLQERGNRT